MTGEEEEERDISVDKDTSVEMANAEIFESSPYDLLLYLTEELKQLLRLHDSKGASVDLKDGCFIALPPN